MAKVDQIKPKTVKSAEDLTEAVAIGPEAYTSVDYLYAERDLLWRKTWLQAGRVEEISEVGNFITYDILDDSIIVIRTAEDSIKAYFNVCPHRGRQLVDCPEGKRNACGRKKHFVCGYHGWQYDLDGENTHIPFREDWGDALTSDNTRLGEVKLDTWGGWIWVNLDPDCEPLTEYLGVVPEMLDPFEPENMRYRWRKWVVFDCNWKVALEAFNESYHVSTTHPEFNKYGQFRGWAEAHGLHSNIGYTPVADMGEDQSGKLRIGTEADPRLTTAEMQNYIWEQANTNTTQTLVDAANRLKDELPEGTPPGDVLAHWLKSSKEQDEARGVVWPTVDPAHIGKSGTAWQIFPNFQIGHSVNNYLCYSARPYGYDPNKCIFEAAVYELYPDGKGPETEWEYTPLKDWPYVLTQDFGNMAAVQRGIRNAGFNGAKPNPLMERSTANLHRNLARYMGAGAPKKL